MGDRKLSTSVTLGENDLWAADHLSQRLGNIGRSAAIRHLLRCWWENIPPAVTPSWTEKQEREL